MDSVMRFHTFGCKVNTYDTGLLEKKFQELPLTSVIQGPVHILNSCAVTAEASREALVLARRLKRENPKGKVIITGCAAQVDHSAFVDSSDVDLIVANSHKNQISEIIQKHIQDPSSVEKLHRSDIFAVEDLGVGGGLESRHTRSFLKIQDGCNAFCTYCIIPFARGKSRSLSVENLVDRVNELQRSGVDEVVLTGIHIADYEDSGRDLADLVEALLLKTSLPRLRLGSLEPLELNDRLLALFRDDRVCPHFHLSIQSADDDVLRAMKRKYQRQDVVRALETIAKLPGESFVGMDVIAGFSTETETQFQNTYQTLRELPWTRMHVFPYSQRTGTFAVRLGDLVEPAVKKARARRLRELSFERYRECAEKQIGRVKSVLWLRGDLRRTPSSEAASQTNSAMGLSLSRDFWHIKVPGGSQKIGESKVLVRQVVASANQDFRLVGEALPW